MSWVGGQPDPSGAVTTVFQNNNLGLQLTSASMAGREGTQHLSLSPCSAPAQPSSALIKCFSSVRRLGFLLEYIATLITSEHFR